MYVHFSAPKASFALLNMDNDDGDDDDQEDVASPIPSDDESEKMASQDHGKNRKSQLKLETQESQKEPKKGKKGEIFTSHKSPSFLPTTKISIIKTIILLQPRKNVKTVMKILIKFSQNWKWNIRGKNLLKSK